MTTVTIVGNTTEDPVLRFTPSGDAVANLTVAVNERRKVGDRFEDDGTTYYRVAVWRAQAENVAESLQKGMRVVVTGKLRTRTYEDKNGQERLSLDLTADEIGPTLRYATATITKTDRDGRQGAGWNQPSQSRSGDDPWANNEPARMVSGDQPPF